jgi:hypothetical protein
MSDVFTKKGEDIGNLVFKKNTAYGDSFNSASKILQILYPVGIAVDDYANVLAIVRVLDKLSRIATDGNAFGENPWEDIAGYAILASVRDDKKNILKMFGTGHEK